MDKSLLSSDYSYNLFTNWIDQFGSETISFNSAFEIIKSLNMELVAYGRSKLFDIICDYISIQYNISNVTDYFRFISVSSVGISKEDTKSRLSFQILLNYISLIRFHTNTTLTAYNVQNMELNTIKEMFNVIDCYIFEQRIDQMGKSFSTNNLYNYKSTQKLLLLLEESLSSVNQRMQQMEFNIIEKQNSAFYNKLISVYRLVSDIYLSINTSKYFIKNKELLKSKNNMKQIMDLLSEYLTDYGIEVLMSEPSSKFNPRTQKPYNEDVQFDPQDAFIERSYRVGFKLDNQIIEKEIVLIKQ